MRENTKVAVLSDIHGNAVALQYAINDLKELGINKVIILGDVVIKGPQPKESLEILQNSGLEILGWVKGNTDLWLEEVYEDKSNLNEKDQEKYFYYKYAKERLSEEEKAFIKCLPEQQTIDIEGLSVLAVHGTPKSIVEAIDSSVSEEEICKAIDGVKENIVLSGHSHTVYIGEHNNVKIFNVGSVGNPLDGDERLSYGILDFSKDKLELENRRLSYPINEVERVAAERNFSGKF